MLRSIKVSGVSCIGIALVIGLFLNAVIILKDRKFFYSNGSILFEGNVENNETVEEPLPLPKLVDKNSILLGKKLPKKVKLAIGMFLNGHWKSRYSFPTYVREISQQDPRPEGVPSVVVVMLMAERRREKIHKILDSIQIELKDLIKKGHVQLVISPFDLDAKTFEKLENSEITEASHHQLLTNYRLAFLYKYCSQVAQHAMIVNSEDRIATGGLNKIYKEIDNMKPNTLHVEFKPGEIFHRLYNGKYLPRVYGTFYALAQLGGYANIMYVITDTSVHTVKSEYKGSPIFNLQTAELGSSNPPATIISTLQSYAGHSAENIYLRKGISWFVHPKKGDHYTVRLKEPVKLKLIYIETGLDSLMKDSFTKSLLEVSYSSNLNTNQCTRFDSLASFYTQPWVEFSKDDKESAHIFDRPIHCIRIKVTGDFSEWAGIRKFILQKDN